MSLLGLGRRLIPDLGPRHAGLPLTEYCPVVAPTLADEPHGFKARSTGSFLGGCRRMCSDLVTDGADRDEPVGELIDGAKQRLSYVRYALGHCSCIRKSRRERATAASVWCQLASRNAV